MEHRLQKVLGKVDNCGLYDDDRSESDPSIDNNYIQETPIKQKKSFTNSENESEKGISYIEDNQDEEENQTAKRKEKEKTESSEDEKESEFFLTKKEKKQTGLQKENVEREFEEVEEHD